MPFYVKVGSDHIIELDQVRVGIGELGCVRDGAIKPLGHGETFVFFQCDGHAVGATREELDAIVARLRTVQKRWDALAAGQPGDEALN